jgi:K+-sensing histidine kinase KdpD
MIGDTGRRDPMLDWFLGDDDTRVSFSGGMTLGLVTYLGLAAVAVAANLDPRIGFAAFAVAVAALAWWAAPAVALSLGAMAFLFVDGFVLNRGGTLSWNGGDDVLRLATLLAIALFVSNSSQSHAESLRRKRVRAALAGRGPRY